MVVELPASPGRRSEVIPFERVLCFLVSVCKSYLMSGEIHTARRSQWTTSRAYYGQEQIFVLRQLGRPRVPGHSHENSMRYESGSEMPPPYGSGTSAMIVRIRTAKTRAGRFGEVADEWYRYSTVNRR